jgi:glycosyltransferase involved in cell wall biosynthesis
MKILQVCPRYYPYIGGIEEHVRNISQRLSKIHDVTVCTTDPSGKLPREEIINRVNVKRFKSWAPNESYHFSRGLKKYLIKNSESFDIVHAHGYHDFPALYAAQAKNNNVLVFTPHYLGRGQTFFRNLLHIPYKFKAKKIFKESDKVICVSKYEKNLVMGNFKLKDEKVLIIPNGVNLDELSKYKWIPSLSCPRITYSGRLERYQKNVDKLIQSFRILTHEYAVDAELVIIGTGPYETGMRRLIKKLRLQKRVASKRRVPRRKYLEELASSNVFVMPSEHECYGIAAAEAIVLGVPTVVSNSSALSEFVESGLALGVDIPITPQGIASAVYEALITPQMTKTRSSQDKILSWDNVTGRLERLYLEVSVS